MTLSAEDTQVVAYRTEEEQIEAVKAWWSEFGRPVIFTVILGLSGSLGWQYWQDREQERQEVLSEQYSKFMLSLEANSFPGVSSDLEQLGNDLKSEFPKYNYSKFIAMHLAKIYVEADMLDQAENELRWIIESTGSHEDVVELAEIRLARILASKGMSDEAIEILSSEPNGVFQALRSTAMGDIAWGLGEMDAATAAYEKAKTLSAGSFSPPRIDEKLKFLNPSIMLLNNSTHVENFYIEHEQLNSPGGD